MLTTANWCILRWLRRSEGPTSLKYIIRSVHSSEGPGPEQRPLPLRSSKPTSSRRSQPRPFIDWRRIRVTAGSGGDGAVSLARVYRNPRAGPDGGDGGAGGHVIFQATTNVKSLGHLDSSLRAEDGVAGSGRDCHGATAAHLTVSVPVGTMFQTEEGGLRASLDTGGAMFVAARGGAGGRGNKYFATDTNQTPRVAERGAAGESFTYTVELRTMADVGLIGFPNAGKSTLLRAVSRARPKVAAYPFTTLQPHVGMVQYSDYTQLAVADIPGLIPDAHRNRGLGVSFLRHVQRCTCLLYVLDVSASPAQQLHVLRHELNMFQPGLADRPHALVANKCDLPGAGANLAELREAVALPVLPISAKMGTNIPELLSFLRRLYDQHRTASATDNERVEGSGAA
ncbi:Mitochondrial ribosome-associated GTPase 2 [Amphibalanus amphitrite]|uniref:Mitochondrial ribosome-associated GTPase 2 n=1 Tax=Amphibalanus amphitrite TaxID=1232801 RepID=A0A6A4WP20_AMPAM|nr:Mitochondrial ribosome-associated GTPase 2 [Amphibalanus amphitrite]